MLATDIQSRFGEAARARRKRLGFSQEALAERAGLHRTYVADVERGARNLSLASIQKLAQALEISLPTLFSQAVGSDDALAGRAVDIVLVEDDPKDVESMTNAFKAAHLVNRLHLFRDGVEALEFFFGVEGRPRRRLQKDALIVLLDLSLPRMSGIEVLRRLKADSRTRPISVVVLAGSEQRRGVKECMRLGAETCLVKPFDFVRFARVLPQIGLHWSLLRMPSTAGGEALEGPESADRPGIDP